MSHIPVPKTCPTCGHPRYHYTVTKEVFIDQTHIPNQPEHTNESITNVKCAVCESTILDTAKLPEETLDYMIDA